MSERINETKARGGLRFVDDHFYRLADPQDR